MEGASQSGILTQPQSWDENSADGANGDAGGFGGVDNNYDANEMNGGDDGVAGGSSMFEVEEYEGGDRQDDEFDEDGFNLLTQSNELFKESAMDGGNSSSSGSSDDSSDSSSGSEDDESNRDSSEDEENDVTPIQERRERNILRNNAQAMKLGLLTFMNGGQPGQANLRPKRKKEVVDKDEGDNESEKEDKEETPKRKKRRGMIFSTTAANKLHEASVNDVDLPLTTKSLVDELTLNYPHRSKQITILCSQLVSIVQKSKFAWQLTDNLRSSGNIQYSEASYQGDTKLAAPSPVMITGAGGGGKTSIVRAAIKALQRRNSEAGYRSNVANAYVDCASSESGSVAAVMNSAYRQLYESYCLSNDKGQVKGNANGGKKGKHVSWLSRTTLGGDDFAEDSDSGVDVEDEDAIQETLLERNQHKPWRRQVNNVQSTGVARGKKMNKKMKAKAAKTKSHNDKNPQKNNRQTRFGTRLATKAASKPASETPTGLKGSVPNANRNMQNSSSVALFGRAISLLIQGNTAKKKSSKSWRCAFLILDNADRILSWKKPGSINPLTQLFLLPSVMGINLTLIFISRSTIYQYSPVHKPPGTLLDAVHPQTIHFDSYTSVDMIKSILHVPHVQTSIMGRSPPTSHKFTCNHANELRSKLNDFLYTTMMNSVVPTVKSSTHDITEIMRLARLLWPEYVAPLDRSHNCDDPSFEALMRKVLGRLRCDPDLLKEECIGSNCSFCKCLSLKTEDDAANVDLNVLKQQLSEKLDKNIRENMRSLLSTTVMMSGRALSNQNSKQYPARLPYITKFLLLAAFLCQHKRAEQDVNLFTTQNTGKSKRTRSKKSDEGSAYASSAKDLTQRQPSFPLERMLSVFTSIIGQYGMHFLLYKEEGASIVSQLGTERLFRNISQLIATGLLCRTGSAQMNEKIDYDLMEMTSAKFMCMISRDDVRVVASDVGFPFEKYCL